MLANILTGPNAYIYIYAETTRCWHTCQHIEVSAHSASGEEYSDIYICVCVKICSYADKYVDMSRCRHICQHNKMLTYMPTHRHFCIFYQLWEICWHISQHICSCASQYVDMSRCRHICQHIKMLTYANILKCRHILLVVINMPTYMSTHLFLWWPICWHV